MILHPIRIYFEFDPQSEVDMSVLKQILNIVVVPKPNLPPTGTVPDLALKVGDVVDLKQFITDPEGDPIKFSVSDNTLVTVAPDGALTAVAEGSGQVEITADDAK
jgi:hypothetical protein